MNPASPDPNGKNGPTHAGESHCFFQRHRLRLAPALRAPGGRSPKCLNDMELMPLDYDFRGARRGLGLCFQLAPLLRNVVAVEWRAS